VGWQRNNPSLSGLDFESHNEPNENSMLAIQIQITATEAILLTSHTPALK
jgi:hypothetical protein